MVKKQSKKEDEENQKRRERMFYWIGKTSSRIPDFDKTLAGSLLPATESVADIFFNSRLGPYVVYLMAKNKKLSAEFIEMVEGDHSFGPWPDL